MILAAIDIGSNAARLLIAAAEQDNAADKLVFTKLNLLRVPLRLGFDVFKDKIIHGEKEQMMIDTMAVYARLMKVYKVQHYRACATSAMRDAANGKAIIEKIEHETGIRIEIITGAQEAGILFETHIAEGLDPNRAYLYIDVGGGSTEVTLFYKNEVVLTHSFNVGTIRILSGQVSEEQWKDIRNTIRKAVKDLPEVTAIGSGGNINKVFSLSKTKEGMPVPLTRLSAYYKELLPLTVMQRMEKYNLRADRADVIVPALEIFCKIMKWSGAAKIYVPKIGLADGLIKMQYDEYAAAKPGL